MQSSAAAGPGDSDGPGPGPRRGDQQQQRRQPPHAVAGSYAALTVSTPGKLILMGEHAVVYGRPALVAAIDLRLRARFSSPAQPPTPGSIEIDLPGLAHRVAASWEDVLGYARRARDGWAAYAAQPAVESFLTLRGDDPAHIVKVALGEAAAALGEAAAAPPLHLRIESDLPIGSGFGSSAAAAVAVVAGYSLWRGPALAAAGRRGPNSGATAGGFVPGRGSDTADTGDAAEAADPGDAGDPGVAWDLDLAAVERLALEAERRQHGLPSGVDTATSLHGGLLWARRPPGGELSCERLATSSPLLGRLRVFHTGMPPEPTGAVVAAVRADRDRDPAGHERLFDRMEAATAALRAELARAAEDSAIVVALLREHEACLEALGVVPAPVRALVRQVEAAGGAAKVSGAGSLAGPGAGSLLVYHSAPARIAEWEFLRPFPVHPVHLGAAGFRRETP
jgi:mevalonate kinase